MKQYVRKVEGYFSKSLIKKLRVGDEIGYSGILYTARDQAHKRFAELIAQNKKLPVDLKGRLIYYCGPTPSPKGRIIGSCGPTTSGRMDIFTPLLLEQGLLGTIGKGDRSEEVVKALKKYHAVYFTTYAGCGALLAGYVKSKKTVCFQDLGAEAVFALEVEQFPLVVAIDSEGGNIYAKSGK